MSTLESGPGRRQIGWRLSYFNPQNEHEGRVWAVGAMGENAARVAVLTALGLNVLSEPREPDALPALMGEAARASGRKWHLLAVAPGEVDQEVMARARRLYRAVFEATLHPYIADRTGLSPQTVGDERATLHTPPDAYSTTEVWFPTLVVPDGLDGD